MRLEITCPICSVHYLIDQDVADGMLSCPSCSAQISILPDAAPPAAAEPPRATPPVGSDEVVCPRCMLHFTPGRAAVKPAAPGERRTVLVLEDLAYFREIARDALAGAYEVKTAETAAEARAALGAGRIDLLILDPSLDGVELLRGMKVKPCPILIYTSQDESEIYGDSWERLRGLGADDIVIKGMNVGESLLRKVDGLLGRQDDEEGSVTNTVISRS